ncbi:hypothetical protein CDN99_20630 [Roseateles aquatilis]|uniref:Uncharacterized protein n=1 Tax=Roseateles aquatilis TaxID=431061 RepID=A0A246J250_9BURK|nr:hypothetical protein [Roseateles aquatilis]OWQ86244.1 hypothetical protein CDN99_20630 [Roseateles aquatilis]
MFKAIRILILLGILVTAAGTTLIGRWQAQSWKRPQVVTLYPINAAGDAATEAYLQRLDESDFARLEPYFQDQARRHGVALSQPIRIVLGRRVSALPPAPPRDRGVLAAISWSLRMRWWAWRETPPSSPVPDVKLFLMYHPPDFSGALPHSIGLEKGRLGLAHLFAARAQQGANEVVIAHETLHTFSATDKYDPATLMPLPPDGYAEPDREPLLPQARAELMAGRIPLRNGEARIPDGLAQTVIGPATAREIGWVK